MGDLVEFLGCGVAGVSDDNDVTRPAQVVVHHADEIGEAQGLAFEQIPEEGETFGPNLSVRGSSRR